MSKAQIKIKLHLIPMYDGVEQAADIQSNSWLQNDNADLLDLKGLDQLVSDESEIVIDQPEKKQSIRKNKNTMQDLLSQLSDEGDGQIYKATALVIEYQSEGYYLSTEELPPVLLKTGDYIALPNLIFKVDLAIEHIVQHRLDEEDQVPASSRDFNDIWTAPSENSSGQAGNRYADPFFRADAKSASTVQTGVRTQNDFDRSIYSTRHDNDPLNFLYDSSSKKSQENYLLGGEPSFSSRPLDGLSINTQEKYQPVGASRMTQLYDHGDSNDRSSNRATVNSAVDTVSSSLLSDRSSLEEGNVLNDLGINEQSSIIAQKTYQSGKPSFQEQSPMDILDEYLDDNKEMGYYSDHPHSPHTNYSQFQSVTSNNANPISITQACKKLLKVFSD